MNKTQIAYIVVTAVVFFFVGTMVDGKSNKDWKRDGYKKQNMHMMGDGTMMHNGQQMNHGDMKGMMDGMMQGLEGKTGKDFDKAFLTEMIVHHEGAVVMAQAVLKNSKEPELIKLANDIISAQTKEIEMMKGWLSEWFK